MHNELVKELIDTIKDKRQAAGWSSESTANYLVGYLSGLIGSIIDEAGLQRHTIEKNLQYYIQYHKEQ